MIIVNGLNGIYAKVLKDSINLRGNRLISYEVSYPRIILAELNTHAMLSKNSSSSRAIPFKKMLEQLLGRPVRFGQANPGMQDKGESYDKKLSLGWTARLDEYDATGAEILGPEAGWDAAKEHAVRWSKAFFEAGYHKQIYNRLTEPFQMMKTVISATEMANFFWLRDDEAADPTLAELARCMREAARLSRPTQLLDGEWHLPYIETEYNKSLELTYFIVDDDGVKQPLTLEEAIQVSAARSAAVSFRNVDYGLSKSQEVHDRLVGDKRKHGSAMEHQATPIAAEFSDEDDPGIYLNVPEWPQSWQPGVSHMDKKRRLWSGKFCGWVQYRKTIPGENVEGFEV